jgi:glucose/arabinose dehydrogenase
MRTSILSLGLVLVWWLVACAPIQNSTPTLSPATDTPTSVLATHTPTPTSQPADHPPSPQATPAPTETFTPLPSTETPLPTATLLPSTPAPIAPLTIPAIRLELVADGLNQPTYLTHAGDESGRLFVVERSGKVRIIQDGELQLDSFMDIDHLVGSRASEQGLLSLAFHPNFRDNRLLFVNYTNTEGDTVIARYQATADRRGVDLATANILLTIPQPFANHNGGQLQFGPDGYLYIGTGDGGSANDPLGNGQNLNVLLGKMLRLDVDSGDSYTIPADNPFVNNPDARPEIWAFGLRNPWRFSFDRLTGDMYIADVGQNAFEEIDYEPAGSGGGFNYGWSIMEGFHCLSRSDCDQTGLILPIAEYSHQQGCSVTGGYVYRGNQFPALDSVYLYADFCSGKIWGLRLGGEPVELSEMPSGVLDTDLPISSFGEDETGEVYLVSFQGEVYRVVSP